MYPLNFGAERVLDLESKDLGFEPCHDCRLAIIYTHCEPCCASIFSSVKRQQYKLPYKTTVMVK